MCSLKLWKSLCFVLPRPVACLVVAWLKPAGSNTVALLDRPFCKHELDPGRAESGASSGKRTLGWTRHRGEGSATDFASINSGMVPSPLLSRQISSNFTRRRFFFVRVRNVPGLETFPRSMFCVSCGRFVRSWRRWATRAAASRSWSGQPGHPLARASNGLLPPWWKKGPKSLAKDKVRASSSWHNGWSSSKAPSAGEADSSGLWPTSCGSGCDTGSRCEKKPAPLWAMWRPRGGCLCFFFHPASRGESKIKRIGGQQCLFCRPENFQRAVDAPRGKGAITAALAFFQENNVEVFDLACGRIRNFTDQATLDGCLTRLDRLLKKGTTKEIRGRTARNKQQEREEAQHRNSWKQLLHHRVSQTRFGKQEAKRYKETTQKNAWGDWAGSFPACTVRTEALFDLICSGAPPWQLPSDNMPKNIHGACVQHATG